MGLKGAGITEVFKNFQIQDRWGKNFLTRILTGMKKRRKFRLKLIQQKGP